MKYDAVKPGTWIGTPEMQAAAGGKISDWLSTDEVAEVLDVSRSRIMSLLRRNRLLAKKFTTKCWAIPVDAKRRPWIAVPDNGPQPRWTDRANVIRYRYRAGPKGRTIDDALSEVEAALEAV